MGMVRQHQCRAHRWSSPPLDHQTVEFGAKGRTGPSPRVAGQFRWAGGRGRQGGGGLHTHPLLPEGGYDRLLSWERKVVGGSKRK